VIKVNLLADPLKNGQMFTIPGGSKDFNVKKNSTGEFELTFFPKS